MAACSHSKSAHTSLQYNFLTPAPLYSIGMSAQLSTLGLRAIFSLNDQNMTKADFASSLWYIRFLQHIKLYSLSIDNNCHHFKTCYFTAFQSSFLDIPKTKLTWGCVIAPYTRQWMWKSVMNHPLLPQKRILQIADASMNISAKYCSRARQWELMSRTSRRYFLRCPTFFQQRRIHLRQWPTLIRNCVWIRSPHRHRTLWINRKTVPDTWRVVAAAYKQQKHSLSHSFVCCCFNKL